MEEIKQKLELGFNPKYAGATNDLLDLISQALQKRDSELLERIKFDMKGRNSLIVEIDDIEQILKDINSNN